MPNTDSQLCPQQQASELPNMEGIVRTPALLQRHGHELHARAQTASITNSPQTLAGQVPRRRLHANRHAPHAQNLPMQAAQGAIVLHRVRNGQAGEDRKPGQPPAEPL